jgi:EthD domain-containing protein
VIASELVLVHGLFVSDEAGRAVTVRNSGPRRAKLFEKYADVLGVRDYEWVEGSGKALANRLLRLARGTARAVDAVEIIQLDEAALRAALVDESARALWQEAACCAHHGFDAARSFILMGAPRQLLAGPANGQRLLWFGRGLSQLSEAEFVAHYTSRHGPLVAKYAQQMGLRIYRQVPSEQNALCDQLRQLGLGRAHAAAVFAELVMGTPPLDLASLRLSRVGTREIKADEKRHIDFSRSMLLLT